MKVIALLFFYQFVLLANASQLYNFNRTGLALREKIQDTKILLIIPYGEKVEFIEHCKVFETVEGVYGEWFKIKFNQKIGFAFGGYLLPIPAPEINSTMGNYMKKNYKFESHEESYNSTYFIEYHTYYYSFQNKKFIYNTEKSPDHFTESLELPFSTASIAYLLGRALYKAYYEES